MNQTLPNELILRVFEYSSSLEMLAVFPWLIDYIKCECSQQAHFHVQITHNDACSRCGLWYNQSQRYLCDLSCATLADQQLVSSFVSEESSIVGALFLAHGQCVFCQKRLGYKISVDGTYLNKLSCH